MARQTSIDCYNQIKAEGLLSRRRMQVYEVILYAAPCTSAEAINNLPASVAPDQSRARFTELRELGVIYEKGLRECRITGRNVIEWDLTNNLPQDYEKPLTTKQKIKVIKSMIVELDNTTCDIYVSIKLQNIKEYIDEQFK